MQLPVYSLTGEVIKQIEVSDYVFGAPFNEAVVHQALVRQQANARHGTSSTKTRGEVSGSTRKIHRQKHTGMARAGSIRSPLRRKGGITFGPKPRSYHQDMPKKMRQLALRCMLSAKARDGELKILEQLQFDQPKTKAMSQILTALGIDSSTLIALHEPGQNVIKSARNLPGVKTTQANLLNVVDILSHKMLIMTEAAAHKAEELWGQKSAQGEKDASV